MRVRRHNHCWDCRLSTMHEVLQCVVLTLCEFAAAGQHDPGEVVPPGGRLLVRRHAVGAAQPQTTVQGHGPVPDPGKPRPRRPVSRDILARGLKPGEVTLKLCRVRGLAHCTIRAWGSAVAAPGSSNACYAHCPRRCSRLMPTRECSHADSEHIESGGAEAAAS